MATHALAPGLKRLSLDETLDLKMHALRSRWREGRGPGHVGRVRAVATIRPK